MDMTDCRHNRAVTLVEMMVVLGIIVVLASLIVTLTRRVDNQSKERSLDSAFSLLSTSLREYYEFRDTFPAQPTRIVWLPAWTDLEYKAGLDQVLAHIELMVQGLKSVPDSRRVLEQLDPELIKNETGLSDVVELRDPWGTLLDYVYDFDAGDRFPELISAGPDKRFGTADDISSKGRKQN